MSMRFRFAQAKDMEQVEALWDYCFEKREESFFQYYFGQYSGTENKIYGAFMETAEGEKLQSMVHLNPYIVRINGQEVELPYLVGVATAEEARGQHLMGEMLKHLWQEPEISTLPFVFLMPINAGIYLPYDFAFTHYRHEYKVSSKALETLQAGERIIVEEHRLELASETLLAPLYDSYTAKYNGVNLRPTKQWRKLLTVCMQEDMQLVVAYNEGCQENGEQLLLTGAPVEKNGEVSEQTRPAVGYMLYHISENTLDIFEMLYADTGVRNALLRQAASIATQTENCENIHWLAPAEDKTYLSFKDQANTGSLAPFMMFRVINREAAIKMCQRACQGDRPLGTREVAYGTAVITQQEEELKEILATLPINSLTQLLLGTFTANELWEEGKLPSVTGEELQKLEQSFPKKKNWINEYF